MCGGGCGTALSNHSFYKSLLQILRKIIIHGGKIPVLKVGFIYLISKHTAICPDIQKHLVLSAKLLTFSRKEFTFV